MYFTDRGIEELSDRRGEETVTIEWVANCLRDFVDQNIEKRPAADRQHRLRRRFGSLAKACAEPAYQNDGLS